MKQLCTDKQIIEAQRDTIKKLQTFVADWPSRDEVAELKAMVDELPDPAYVKELEAKIKLLEENRNIK